MKIFKFIHILLNLHNYKLGTHKLHTHTECHLGIGSRSDLRKKN